MRLGRWLAIFALFGACGGHWLVLQSVAWSGMLLEHARTSGVITAVEQTFSGQNPCKICKTIEQGKKTEKKTDVAPLLIAKLEFFHRSAGTVLIQPPVTWVLNFSDSAGSARSEPPLLRPPRFA